MTALAWLLLILGAVVLFAVYCVVAFAWEMWRTVMFFKRGP